MYIVVERARRGRGLREALAVGLSVVCVCVCFVSSSSACCSFHGNMGHTRLLLHSCLSLDILDPLRPSDGIKLKSQHTRRCWGALRAEHSGLRVHPTRSARKWHGRLVALRRYLREEPGSMPFFVVVSAPERVVYSIPTTTSRKKLL